VAKDKLGEKNMAALEKGIENLIKQLENIQKFGLPVVVALNEFPTDTREEVDFVIDQCAAMGADVALSRVWAEGGAGGEELAQKVVAAAEKPSTFKFLYELEQPLKAKIETVCREIYGADGVSYTAEASRLLQKFEDLGYGSLPVCMAKTQYSLSDDPDKKGRPRDFTVNVKEVRLSAGAGFVVALTGTIMTMPGLGKTPAAEKIDIKPNGEIVGLF
ncbi:formate--tetrahydrofolate ligase, partial [Anaerotignum sp.]|uniref:formate--tetrahydrofolate ligase n=1 Tax=Anaerotignum sp. TaxID=2039241 RepID=UPI00332EE19C